MRVLWRLATRNWWTNPGRTVAGLLAVALGVAQVVIITSLHETVMNALTQEVQTHWIGAAHISLSPPGAHHGRLDAASADELATFDNVTRASVRLRRRANLVRADNAEQIIGRTIWWIDAVGIRPETDQHFFTLPNLSGHMIAPEERGVCVLERKSAQDWGIELGADVFMAPYFGGPRLPVRVVGLFDSERIGDFQQPSVYAALADVQELMSEPGAASQIDLQLVDTSPAAIDAMTARIEQWMKQRGLSLQVDSASSRLELFAENRRFSRLFLSVVSFVSQLTAFFIIVTTVGVSLYERRAALGMMRCVGLTRGQLASLVFLEVAPIGVVGAALGALAGIGGTGLIARLGREFVREVLVSRWGLMAAVLSGLATTLIAAFILIVRITRLQPVVAVNVDAVPPQRKRIVTCAIAGLTMICIQTLLLAVLPPMIWAQAPFAFFPGILLDGGYALCVPAIIVTVGRLWVHPVASMVRLRPELAQDPFVRSPWRGATICWMMMIGVSLIAYLAVRSGSVRGAWDFTTRLPQTFVWSPQGVPPKAVERVRQLPSVSQCFVVADVDCEISLPGEEGKSVAPTVFERFLRSLSRPVYVAGDVDEFLSIIRVNYVEGEHDDVVRKLRQGGHVVVPRQTAEAKGLHLGDPVVITIDGTSSTFTVAAVVQSPALDVAVTFFRASSYMQFAAASAFLGTRADLKERFGIDAASMVMCNLNMAPALPPPGIERSTLPDHADSGQLAKAMLAWREHLPNEQESIRELTPEVDQFLADGGSMSEELRTVLRRYAMAVEYVAERWDDYTPQENWDALRERLIIFQIADVLERPGAFMGSLQRLRQFVDRTIFRATTILTWTPSIALVVAAIGIANLMMLSVHARSRQIAVLRAVGALKSQVLRMVLCEAITLGLIGSAIGVVLGLHHAFIIHNIATQVGAMEPPLVIPWSTIGLAVLVATTICTVAGIGPARHAARSNIVSALQTS